MTYCYIITLVSLCYEVMLNTRYSDEQWLRSFLGETLWCKQPP